MKLTCSLVILAGVLLAPAVQANSTQHQEKAAPQKLAPQRIEIAVTSEGFVPAQTKAKVGQPVTLVVTRKVERTCATDLVMKDYGINKPLPINVPVEVTLTPRKAGIIRYSCAMDMIAGELVAE